MLLKIFKSQVDEKTPYGSIMFEVSVVLEASDEEKLALSRYNFGIMKVFNATLMSVPGPLSQKEVVVRVEDLFQERKYRIPVLEDAVTLVEGLKTGFGTVLKRLRTAQSFEGPDVLELTI